MSRPVINIILKVFHRTIETYIVDLSDESKKKLANGLIDMGSDIIAKSNT